MRFSHIPHIGVFISFGLYSFAFGALFPRLGDLQLQLGISQTILGLSIIGVSIGVQISLLIAGRIVDTIGFRRTMLWGVPLVSASEMLAALSTSPIHLFLALFLTGICIGLIEVAVNLEADRVEHQLGRRIMNRSHAFWSFGFFGAGLFGALLAQLDISAFHHLTGFLILNSLLSFVLFHQYQAAPKRPDDEHGHITFARPTKPILGLVALSLSAMLLEGAGIDWSVIFMRDIFGTPPFISGLALTLFAMSQFIVRYVADSYVEIFGAERISLISLIILGSGVLCVSLSFHPVMALGGFMLIGGGTAVIFPLTISAAAQLKDRSSAVNVASFAQLSFMVFLLAPPLLGIIADYFGIRLSYAIGLPLVIISLMTVKSLRRP